MRRDNVSMAGWATVAPVEGEIMRRMVVLAVTVSEVVGIASSSLPYSSSTWYCLNTSRFLDSARMEEHSFARHARLVVEDTGLDLSVGDGSVPLALAALVIRPSSFPSSP